MRETAERFFANLKKNYPNTKIFALAPIWRVNLNDKKDLGEFNSIFKVLNEISKEIENMIIIDCIDFIPHSADYLADKYVHPNDDGFECYAENLYCAMSRYL